MATLVLALSVLLEPRLDHTVLAKIDPVTPTRPCSLSQSSSRTPPLRSIVLTNARALLPALRAMSQILSPGVTFRGCRSRSAAGTPGVASPRRVMSAGPSVSKLVALISSALVSRWRGVGGS